MLMTVPPRFIEFFYGGSCPALSARFADDLVGEVQNVGRQTMKNTGSDTHCERTVVDFSEPIARNVSIAAQRIHSGDDAFTNAALSKIESLRQMSGRFRAAAKAAFDPGAKRHYARRALELAQEAEALARLWGNEAP
jgi:hypothetical protein